MDLIFDGSRLELRAMKFKVSANKGGLIYMNLRAYTCMGEGDGLLVDG
jgi:hypothetical protein